METSIYKCGVDLIVLSLLVESDQGAAELSAKIVERSSGIVDPKIGPLYQVLFSLEDRGYIISNRSQLGRHNGVSYYHIEPKGIAYLQRMLPAYRAYSNACLNLLLA